MCEPESVTVNTATDEEIGEASGPEVADGSDVVPEDKVEVHVAITKNSDVEAKVSKNEWDNSKV